MANFDRIAACYLPAERLALGWWLDRTREFFLREAAACREAVLFGDGDGRFAAALLGHTTQLHATAVDGSREMLALLENRCRRAIGDPAQRLTLQHADARPWQPRARPDLIVTHFFLDCLQDDEAAELARRMADVARPDCLWLLSDFAEPRHQPWKTAGQAYIRMLYAAFGLLTGLPVRRLPAMRHALAAAGFRELRRREFLGGLLFTSLWRLDRDATRVAPPAIHSRMSEQEPIEPIEEPGGELVEDAIPDPEPSVPSLPQPDPEVFEHEA